MTAVNDRIIRKIRAKQRGWVFTPKDFLDFGSRAAIDQALSRLARAGVIRRLDRGLYDYPKQHAVLGTLSPDVDRIADAVSAKTGESVFPSGAMAANYMGLSTQVPAKPSYLTNGASKVRKIAGRTLTFKHARVPILDQVPAQVNYTLQALAYLGRDNVDADVIKRCAKRLDGRDLKALNASRAVVPGWMADVILKIESAAHG